MLLFFDIELVSKVNKPLNNSGTDLAVQIKYNCSDQVSFKRNRVANLVRQIHAYSF